MSASSSSAAASPRCGAGVESMRWAEGFDLQAKRLDRAAMDRSGALAQRRSAINTDTGENDPSDHARTSLIGDVGRQLDGSAHRLEWDLPVWKQRWKIASCLPASRTALPAFAMVFLKQVSFGERAIAKKPGADQRRFRPGGRSFCASMPRTSGSLEWADCAPRRLEAG